MRLEIIKKFIKLSRYLYDSFFPEYFKLFISNLLDPLPRNRRRANVVIRTENYFQACKKELKKDIYSNTKNYHLHNAFKKHLVRSNLIDDEWWSDFILLVSLPKGLKFKQINESLINRIEYSNFNSFEYFELLDIYALCLRFSLFELGYHLRQKSLKIALGYFPSSKNNESWKLKAKLSALLEIGNFSEFDRLLPFFKNGKKQDKYFLIYLKEILQNINQLSTRNFSFNLDVNENLNFKKFIDDKKIVIVSPKLVSTKDGNKIDNADIVIRTNYKMGDTKNKGSRSDINYFNLETSQYIEKNGCPEWPSDIKWIVGRARNYIQKILTRLKSDGMNLEHLNTRALTRVDNALFYGSLFMLPNIIIDLSRYKPKEIFLYHFDLLLSKDRIPGYFTDVKNNNELHLKLIKNLTSHDPVINFIILKLFWKKGFINGDINFEEVMKMETKDYMISLQKNYRKDNSFETD